MMTLPDTFQVALKAHQEGRLEEAKQQYIEILKTSPQQGEVHYLLGRVYQELGEYTEALRAFYAAKALNPQNPDLFYHLGGLLMNMNQPQEAALSLKIALKLNPEYAEAMFLMAHTQYLLGLYPEARHWYQEAAQRRPDNIFYQLRHDLLCPAIFPDRQALQGYREQLESCLKALPPTLPETFAFNLNDLPVYGCESPFHLMYHDGDNRALKETLGRFYHRLFEARFPQWMTPITPKASAKPRIGFVVTYRHEGIFCKLMQGYVNHLDRSQFEVTIFCGTQTSVEAISSQIQNPDTHYEVLPSDLVGKIKTLRERAFDALFHFEVGTDAANYFLPFFALAPVQFTGMGWPDTTGIPAMTHFLSSRYVELPEADDHYGETLVRLDGSPVCFPKPVLEQPIKDRAAFGLPDAGQAIYLVPQNLSKIHPDYDTVLAGILAQDPLGHVILLNTQEQWRQAVMNRLSVHPDFIAQPALLERLHFIPRQSATDILTLMALSDVMLDPFYVNGGTTSLEGLAMGTPIVTLPSRHFRGRMTQAFYRRMDWMTCVVESVEAYIALAVKLGTDSEFRQSVRRAILARNEVLFDNPDSVRSLEAFLKQAVAPHRTEPMGVA